MFFPPYGIFAMIDIYLFIFLFLYFMSSDDVLQSSNVFSLAQHFHVRILFVVVLLFIFLNSCLCINHYYLLLSSFMFDSRRWWKS